jgi:hypothetical protein
MLQSRIALLKSRLASLPPSYLTSSDTPAAAITDSGSSDAPPHQLLRAVQALTAKLALVAAFDPPQLATESAATRADAALVDLLATLGTNTRQARQLGGRFAARESSRRTGGAFDRSTLPAPDDFFLEGEMPLSTMVHGRLGGSRAGGGNSEDPSTLMEL